MYAKNVESENLIRRRKTLSRGAYLEEEDFEDFNILLSP